MNSKRVSQVQSPAPSQQFVKYPGDDEHLTQWISNQNNEIIFVLNPFLFFCKSLISTLYFYGDIHATHMKFLSWGKNNYYHKTTKYVT